ncbi:MAG: glycoside hydrolase family 2 [Clostridia bacterium]|nr:glycoside hydrolase family 2 [Clostridia bacterium]
MGKAKKYETLKTRFAKSFNKENPLPEYPRPQLRRDSYISLNGEWDFGVGGYYGKITVPYAPESLLSGIEKTFCDSDILHYRKFFKIPDGFKKDRIILHFGAVDQVAYVKLNGRELGIHKGGYHPFSFDVTDFLVDGENELEITVSDKLDGIFPYGKQKRKRGGMWYTPVTGIWQTVWLESLPKGAIQGLKITSNMTSVKIECHTSSLPVKLTMKESGKVYESNDGNFEIAPESAKTWSPESPYLYYFTLENENDKIDSYFALREIGIKKFNGTPRLTLNGKPYLFNGLLDQGYFPDGIYTPASYEAFRDDILTAKSLGFNMLRKHIKIEPLIFYHLCDTLGMAVFQDMVNNSDYSFLRDTALPTVGMKKISDKKLHKNELSREIFRSAMKETQELLYNSPSVLYYTVFNEGWGQFSADENYALAKKFDPTRIYDATSGWFVQSESDVDSHHIYFKKAKISDFSKRPVVLSEFGGYSYRQNGHLFGSANYGYSLYKTKDEFEKAFLKLYRDEILPLAKKGVSALVYTQISDVEDETNGFMTYDRECIKPDAEKTRALMRELYKISNSEKNSTVTE